MRKRIAIVLTAAVLTVSTYTAQADKFIEDFNSYAEGYGIPEIKPVVENISYKSSEVEILNIGEVDIYGENPISVISSACCALRAIDNGSQIDQYGRVLHAFFLNKSSRNEARATTETGVLIFCSEEKGIYTIRLVK